MEKVYFRLNSMAIELICLGALLISVQIIRKENPGQTFSPPPSIIPTMRKAYIEIIALGIRDMLPYNFVPMQNPYLEIEHYSFSEEEVEESKFRLRLPGYVNYPDNKLELTSLQDPLVKSKALRKLIALSLKLRFRQRRRKNPLHPIQIF